MAFTVPTLDEMHLFLVALLKALFPDLDVTRTSFPALFARVLAAAATDSHAHVTATRGSLLPTTAEGPMLDAWGAIVGRARKGATPARKADALRIVNSGSASANVTVGMALTHVATGLRFEINENATIDEDEYKDVDVVAVDTGSATRLAAGEILRFDTPIAHLEEDAELQIDLDEDGDDQEADAAYRARVLARFATPPLGGAQNDYVQWALEIDGIAAAYCYPTRAGLGTVDVAALHAGTGAARALNGGERAELLAYLDARRPVHATVRVLEVTTTAVDVEVRVRDTGEEAFAWDWIDETPLEVDSWDDVTRTLTFATDRPDTMRAGGRLVLGNTDGNGVPVSIESLAGTDSVVLQTLPGGTVTAGVAVYAGGALTAAVRAAITDHVNGLGTANPDAARYGAWEGTLRTAALYRVATVVPGVLDLELVTPTANVEAADPGFPLDDTIGLLVPGRVIVRRWWS